jgi:3-deoxy-D-arabino-heptulosonate 7-phosphate (DAHP) synthase
MRTGLQESERLTHDTAAVARVLRGGVYKTRTSPYAFQGMGNEGLKHGMSSTIREWLLASEYILSGGNYDVIRCDRGIRRSRPSDAMVRSLNTAHRDAA